MKKIIAFFDAVAFAVISSILLTIALTILVSGRIGKSIPMNQNWYLAVIVAFCIAIPSTAMFCLQRVSIDLNCDKVDFFYLVNYAKNDKDINSNWFVYPSEIKTISVVKLTKNEKRKYTSARFIFSKYLKVEMRYDHVKYIYVSHYSNRQINKIIKMLTKNISQSKNILS